MTFEDARRRMVEAQLRGRGLEDPRLLRAFFDVPRHDFVPAELQAEAYADRPLPIGAGQTISQPYIVGLTLSLLRLQGHERVLEIGTGSGYQTALLARLALEVYSVERLPELAETARERLARIGALNAHLHIGDGSLGWAAHAPYDAMVVAAGVPQIPPALVDQLADPGRLVIPVGTARSQILTVVERRGGALRTADAGECSFVPLIGQDAWPPSPS
ncbi:MAG: protein-L-isoaspartate(D-aspartate) O-methyltransferase [Candidatus Omnitrophica bacterium]|nr:protein-L-isoaspartate(D-aspartate) O-methyltransferase [Candidatus Omnitrophota bacterium]